MNTDLMDMITGTIKKMNLFGEKKSLLIEDSDSNEYVFHINDHTIVMAFNNLKPGQEVDIIFNGILTRSLPPQGNALIVNGLKL